MIRFLDWENGVVGGGELGGGRLLREGIPMEGGGEVRVTSAMATESR